MKREEIVEWIKKNYPELSESSSVWDTVTMLEKFESDLWAQEVAAAKRRQY